MREGRREFANAEHPAETYRKLICEVCDFYKPGESLQCGAFKILVRLVGSGSLTLEEIENAASQVGGEGDVEEIR